MTAAESAVRALASAEVAGLAAYVEAEIEARVLALTGVDVLDVPLETALERLEVRMIRAALARTKGNATEAASLLGLARSTLGYRIEKHGI